MEKLQKYCLSVLLVIICSNVSAQIGHGGVDNEDYKRLYEVYSQFLTSQTCKEVKETSPEKKRSYFAIHQKKSAIDFVENIFPGRQNVHPLSQFLIKNFEEGRHNQILSNFEKQSKGNYFAEQLYFKSKVSKVRNKDYLELMS